METPLLLSLFVASAVNAAIPGPSLLLVVARAARGGLRAGIDAAIGATLAVAMLLTVVMAVMFGALRLGEPAFTVMKLGGILLLTVFGVRMLRAKIVAGSSGAVHSRHGNLLAGFLVGAMSPFNLFFFLALIPQFIDPSGLLGQPLALAISIVLLGSAIPVAVVALLTAGHARMAPGGAIWVVRASGAMLLGFAALSVATLT